MSVLDQYVTLFRGAKKPTPVEDITLRAALDRIRTGKYQKAVDRVLAAPPDRQQNVKSIALPGFTPSGSFRYRKKDNLRPHSGVVVLDLDDKTDAEGKKAELAEDPHVLAAFQSPRGGVKVLVPIFGADPETGELRLPENDAEHKVAMAAVFEHFGHEDPDPTGKDVSRLCYFSVDPDPYVNERAEPVEFELEEDGTATPAPLAGRASYDDVIPYGHQHNVLATTLGLAHRRGRRFRRSAVDAFVRRNTASS